MILKNLLAIGLLCMLSPPALADGLAERLALLPPAKVPEQEQAGTTAQSDDKVANAEQKVLDFVKKHQPELLKLLMFLKERQPAQFQQALKEMARSQQRLEGLLKRDPELYAVELQLWQTQSRIRMLAAEMSVSNSIEKKAELEKQLQLLVGNELDHERARLVLLKARAEQEVQRLDKRMSELSDNREEQVAKGVKLWQNRIARQARARKPK
jgi:ribosome-binding ATPase YchF (GTP1/OBG family)